MRTKLVIAALLSVVAGGLALAVVVAGTSYLGADPAVARWSAAAVVLAVIATPLVALLERTNRRAAGTVGGARVPTAPSAGSGHADRDTARTLDELRSHR